MVDRDSCSVGAGKHLLKVNVLHSMAAVGTQILITKNQNSVLVDAGDGCLRDLVSRKFRFETLKAVFLTHEHFDHISGLYSLVNFLILLGRREPLPVATPRPSARIHTLLQPPLLYYSPEFLIPILELSGADESRIGSFQVRAFEVSHAGTNSLGYSILDDDGRKVAISGDTRLCPNLEREVVGADIAVLESTYEDEDRDFAHDYGHMTRSEARDLGRRSKHAILIHGSPEGYFEIDHGCRLK
jgi:ribonuclease BN (tRNA processing enzyme)